MPSPVLDIQNASKRMGGQAVLSDVNLQVVEGEAYGLIGLNGAGKTTLIKCMLDLQRADSGAISVFRESSFNPLARKQLIYLPEKFLPPDYMDGWIYLKYVTDAYDAPVRRAGKNPEWGDRVRALCGRLELDAAALEKNVRQFSKGMLQKLGLIGCLLSDKPFLILDEPASGLDPKARVLFRQAIEELRARRKTLLLCTHILNDIETLCDRISILHRGHILFTGTPEECCKQYQVEDLESAFLISIK
jgi:ABC-2 type transport system ATP-binding protein